MSELAFSWSTAAPHPADGLSLQQLSNPDLVRRCQNRSGPRQSAFAELIRRYQSHVDRLLYHLAPDWRDRADLSQEVWIRVYRNLRRLQEPDKFKTWLSRIVTNLFYDELRKRKRFEVNVSLDAPRRLNEGQVDWDIAADEPGPVEQMVTQEFYDRLKGAISELPAIFRTTIILREIQGLSYEEIAAVTHVSVGTVKSRIARARHRLQRLLKRYLDPEPTAFKR
ncbi:MAG: sigma-70 family RNA polymerase sigma factor [Cyanobacteria bacterium J06554_6]